VTGDHKTVRVRYVTRALRYPPLQLADQPTLAYKVEYTSPLMSGPKDVAVGPSDTPTPLPGSTAGEGVKGTKLPVTFETKGPGK
jgi:hypothetical protein